MARQGKRELGLTLDQANTLFLIIFVAAFVGGKLFLLFENASYYLENPSKLISGSGFVFYGSFLFAVPSMLIYFRRNKIATYQMLDIMAITTCLVHMFGRLGCFMAGCCYGLPTGNLLGVTFTNAQCAAKPLGTPLHPTQLYEAGYILIVMTTLLIVKKYYQSFRGQLFLLYLILYAVGRFVIEIYRGDLVRGFLVDRYISTSQAIALMIMGIVAYFYVKLSKRNRMDSATH
jgi:phosphatidylglycerol:prolipoprotein diacylglycerol transferase